MSKITSHTKTISEFTDDERIQCHNLLLEEFDGVIWDDFIKDFEEKEYAMYLMSEGRIVGFSTMMFIDVIVEGQNKKLIFSGDTTVLRKYRESFGFAVEMAKLFVRAIDLFPCMEIYYVLISKGYRTYRILPFYFKHFSPSYICETSREEQSIIAAFGQKKYPNQYRHNDGLLMFDGTTQRLKLDSIDAVQPFKGNPHTDFFFKKNPDYLLGNELICIAKVCPENFTSAIVRLVPQKQKI